MAQEKIFTHGGDHYIVFRSGDDRYIYDGVSFYKRVKYGTYVFNSATCCFGDER